MIYLIGMVFAFLFVSLMARIWNEINLDSRQFHRLMAGHYIEMGQRELALTHIEKARKLQKWFIRFI